MRVLLVEDEAKIASFLRKALEEQGFTVDLTGDGDDAFLMATTQSFDAIILDIMLPGRDGLSILQQLRERHNPVPVILVTARDSEQDVVDGLDAGADYYLTKSSFHDNSLLDAVHSLIGEAGVS